MTDKIIGIIIIVVVCGVSWYLSSSLADLHNDMDRKGILTYKEYFKEEE